MRSISISRGKGFSRRSTKEFGQFLFIAKGSVAEVQSQLYVALDQGYINEEKFDELYTKSDEVARLISGFIRYLLNKDKPQALKQPNKLNKPKQLKELK
jgi:four helix bundle protein